MGKRLFERFCGGFACATLVSMVINYILLQTKGAAVTPEFARRFANEAAAAIAQIGLVGLIGAAFALSSLIFEIERWSFLRQGILHFIITAAVWMPIAWLCWPPVYGAALWWSIGGWTLTYLTVWLVQYLIYRRSIAQLNRIIRSRQGGEEE